MISVMFDKIRFDCADSEEFDNYYQLNVEPTARPLSINVDYNNALSICYRNISDAIEGRKIVIIWNCWNAHIIMPANHTLTIQVLPIHLMNIIQMIHIRNIHSQEEKVQQARSGRRICRELKPAGF